MAEYITKDQVIEWFRPYGHTEEGIPFDVLETDIAGMQAADVAPVVHGRWIYEEETLSTSSGYRCSACRRPRWLSPDVPEAFKYCPHCGAKMDGGVADG